MRVADRDTPDAVPLVEKLQNEYDGIIKATRIRRGFGNDWIEIDQNVNIPIGGFFVDPEFLTLFEYKLESGNPATALSQPNSVVLKKKIAEKKLSSPDKLQGKANKKAKAKEAKLLKDNPELAEDFDDNVIDISYPKVQIGE